MLDDAVRRSTGIGRRRHTECHETVSASERCRCMHGRVWLWRRQCNKSTQVKMIMSTRRTRGRHARSRFDVFGRRRVWHLLSATRRRQIDHRVTSREAYSVAVWVPDVSYSNLFVPGVFKMARVRDLGLGSGLVTVLWLGVTGWGYGLALWRGSWLESTVWNAWDEKV